MSDISAARVTRSDVSRLAKFARTGAGAVRVPATASRTGIQEYPGAGPGGSTLREYRDPAEVFAADSLAAFASIPVTFRHPSEGVSPQNARTLTVGHVSDMLPESRVKVDGDPNEWVRVQMVISDGDVLQLIDSMPEAPEVSMGYSCVLDMTPGVTPDGQPYHARQTKIVPNHLAILPRGDKARAGANAKLRLDQQEKMKVILIDGAEFEFGSEKHIARLDADHQKALAASNAATVAATARADKAEAERDSAKDALKAAELTTDALDAKVEARFALIQRAAKLLPGTYETKGKSDAQIRLDAVTAKVGADKLVGKSELYVECRFDALTDDAAAPVADYKVAPAAKTDATVAKVDSDEAFRAAIAKKDAQ